MTSHLLFSRPWNKFRPFGLSMKTPIASLLLGLALLTGCGHSSEKMRSDGTGFFTLTNQPGTVYWGYLHDSTTNDIQFVLLLPDADQTGPNGVEGRQRPGYDYYDYFYLKTKRNSHQWKIEADVSQKTGTGSLQFSDLTANTATNIDLGRSRVWQISDDGRFTPLDKIDAPIAKRVLAETESAVRRSNPIAE